MLTGHSCCFSSQIHIICMVCDKPGCVVVYCWCKVEWLYYGCKAINMVLNIHKVHNEQMEPHIYYLLLRYALAIDVNLFIISTQLFSIMVQLHAHNLVMWACHVSASLHCVNKTTVSMLTRQALAKASTQKIENKIGVPGQHCVAKSHIQRYAETRRQSCSNVWVNPFSSTIQQFVNEQTLNMCTHWLTPQWILGWSSIKILTVMECRSFPLK